MTPIDFFINFNSDETKKSGDAALASVKSTFKSFKDMSADFDRLAAGNAKALMRLSAGGPMGGLLKHYEDIALAQRRAMTGLPASNKARSGLQKTLRDLDSDYSKHVKALDKEIKTSGANWEQYADSLIHVRNEYKEMRAEAEKTIKMMSGPNVFQKIMGAMSISPMKYMALSQALRDVRGSLPATIRGMASAGASLSEGGTIEGEQLARISAQRGGDFGAGRGVIPGIMLGAGAGVNTRTAVATGAGMMQAGWSAAEAAGPLGQAVAALSTARGVSVDAAIGMADSLRAAGMKDDQIVQFLGTMGKRHKFGQEAMSSVSAGIAGAMPYLQQHGINVGGAAESMSRMQEVIARGLGMGSRGAGIAGQFIQQLGTQMGDPTAVMQLAAFGVTPDVVRAAMSGNLKPLIAALRGQKNASPYQLQAMSRAFGVDVNQLSSIISRADKFTEEGVAGPTKDSADAMKELSDMTNKATNTFEKIINVMGAGMSWLNAKTGGLLGQAYESDVFSKLAAATYLAGQVARPLGGLMRGMGRAGGAMSRFGGSVIENGLGAAMGETLGGIFGGRLSSGYKADGSDFGLPKNVGPFVPGAPSIPAAAPKGPWYKSGMGRAGLAGGALLGAGLAGWGALTTDYANGNWADRIGGSMQGIGTAGMLYGGLAAATGIGLPAAAILGIGGAATAGVGYAIKSILGKPEGSGTNAQSAGDDATQVSARANVAMVSILEDVRNILDEQRAYRSGPFSPTSLELSRRGMLDAKA
jgi:hypothetical protein